MELRHLRYFVAVAEELNFRKASERLRVAQPALSSQIQDLEAELGIRLFDRNTGGARLTQAGLVFLSETRLTLAQAEKAARVAKEAAAGMRGHIAIGYIAALSMDFIPATLTAFRKLYPNVEVRMVQTWSFLEQIHGLETGELSLAFAVRPDDAFPEATRRMVVIDSESKIAMGRTHKFAKRKSVSLSELTAEPFLCFGGRRQDSPHAEIVRRIFASARVPQGPVQMVDGIEALHATVASGLGVTLLADIAGVARHSDLVMKRISDPGVDLMVQLRAFWRRDRESVALRNFLTVLAKVRRVPPPTWDGAED